MISVQIISTIIGGARLALSVAQYLDSNKPNWRTEQICMQLDAIRDAHLKAGYQFLKDAALSTSDESCKKCLELAYSEFVLASKSYPIDTKYFFENFDLFYQIKHYKPGNLVERKIFHHRLKEYYGIEDVDYFIKKMEQTEYSTEPLIESLAGLAFCNLLLNEEHRAKDALVNLLSLKAKLFIFMITKLLQKEESRCATYHIKYTSKRVNDSWAYQIFKCLEIGQAILLISPDTDLHKIPNYTKFAELAREVGADLPRV